MLPEIAGIQPPNYPPSLAQATNLPRFLVLSLVHAAVDQEVGGAFRDRSADPQTGPMAFGIVDQPSALAGQIALDLAQRRRRDDGSLFRSPCSPWKTGMTWRMRSIVTLASLALPFQMRQCRTSATITARAFSRSGVSAGRVLAVLSACCRRMAMWNQSSNGGFVTPALSRIERSPEQPSVKAVNSVSAVLPTSTRPRWISASIAVSVLATAANT